MKPNEKHSPMPPTQTASSQSAGRPSQRQTTPQKNIIEQLKKVRFKRRMFGGVDEKDVWKKIEQLNDMYEQALRAERIRYNALLEQQSRQLQQKRQEGVQQASRQEAGNA